MMYKFGEMSLVEMFNNDKERLINALNGRVANMQDDGNIGYQDGSEEECREAIIAVFDSAVYHALQNNSTSRVLEKVMAANGVDIKDGQVFKDFVHYKDLDATEQANGVRYNAGDPENPEDLDE